jgi:hypothetical protein
MVVKSEMTDADGKTPNDTSGRAKQCSLAKGNHRNHTP